MLNKKIMNKANKQKIKKIALVTFLLAFAMDTSFACASQITPDKMAELTNGSRKEAGLAVLAVNEKLEKAAKMKANDMLINQYFEHTSPEGVTPWAWFEKAGYEYVYAAENLAIDFVTAEGAHRALMESTGHRENILGHNYKEIGIAVVSGEFEGKDTILIVEEFGSRREHKITVNNAEFFETTTVKEAEEEAPAEEAKAPEEALPVAKAGAGAEAEAPTGIASGAGDAGEETEAAAENAGIGGGQRAASELEGRSVPKVYAVRNLQTLKRVYVEDIYWVNVREGSSMSSLGSGASAIRIFLKDLIGGIIYALM